MLEMIKNFVFEYRFVIAIVVCFVLFYLFEREKGYSLLYNLMLQAKRLAKDAILKSGQAQEDWVVEKALYLLPVSWKVFISETQTRKIVKWLFNKGKDLIDDGKLNNSWGE
jgi:hypothetical protein